MHIKGILIAGAIATLLTVAVAWPVIVSPTEMIYGHEILGRHPDAYALIQQFGGGPSANYYAQPLIDLPGRLLARLVTPVFAFNALVLLSFPLTAMATYAFARYLYDSHVGALIAALGFAFAPVRLAHAAYHADLTQTQWLPLFFLALVAVVDRVSVGRIAALIAATFALLLSNYYWSLIGLVLSPVLIMAFWVIRPDANRNLRPLLWPAAVVAAITVVGGFVLAARHAGPFNVPDGVPMSIDDVSFFRARWWAYGVPSVDHPVLGGLAERRFALGGIDLELVEQQLYIGYAFLALGAAGLAIALWRRERRWLFLAPLLATAAFAWIVSIGPTTGSCDGSMAAGCLGYQLVPMLRAWGRFGIAVDLFALIAAGAGAALLLKLSSTGRYVAVVLIAIAVFEYWPLPARAHDVLPSSGHRWIAAQPGATRTLDCFPNMPSEQSIPSLMPQPVTLLTPSLSTCADPELGGRLAALDYTHVIVRDRKTASRLPTPLPPGLTVAKQLKDATVYAVAHTQPAVVVVASDGFFGYEHAGDDYWRWMSPKGSWTIRNTSAAKKRVELDLDLVPMGVPRKMSVAIDGTPVSHLDLPMTRSDYHLGPFDLAPGDHSLTFAADGPPTRPSDVEESKDRRPLTVAFRNDRWTITDAPHNN
jgi:hypothetical protein